MLVYKYDPATGITYVEIDAGAPPVITGDVPHFLYLSDTNELSTSRMRHNGSLGLVQLDADAGDTKPLLYIGSVTGPQAAILGFSSGTAIFGGTATGKGVHGTATSTGAGVYGYSVDGNAIHALGGAGATALAGLFERDESVDAEAVLKVWQKNAGETPGILVKQDGDAPGVHIRQNGVSDSVGLKVDVTCPYTDANGVEIDIAGGGNGINVVTNGAGQAIVATNTGVGNNLPVITAISPSGTTGPAIFCDGPEKRRHSAIQVLNYTVTETDNVILMSTTGPGGPVTVTLLVPAGNEGKRFRIIDVGNNATARNIQVVCQVGATFVGGGAARSIALNGGAMDVEVLQGNKFAAHLLARA